MKKTRSCGSCNACCVGLHINELDKPANEPCKHLNSERKGCSIYAGRPGVCRVFSCAWLDGRIDSAMRPDRSGIIVWGASKEVDPLGDLVIVKEVRKGALSESANMGLLRQLMKKVPVAVMPYHGRQDWFGPPEKLERIRHLPVIQDAYAEAVPCAVTVHDGTIDEVMAREAAAEATTP